MNVSPLLSASGIEFGYSRGKSVLSNLSFFLNPGEIVLLSGANGSGKTTLIKILAGLIRSFKGQVDFQRGQRSLFLPDALLYGDLTLGENLELFGSLFQTSARLHNECIEAMGIGDILRSPFRDLSRGQKIRGALARTFMADTALTLLDEPLTGLDDEAAARLGTLLAGLKERGKTVLFSTHHEAGFSGIVSRRLRLQGGALV
ncbi:MAG: ABC transporter ATP-binding protein [Deltaproteobacteria bacterium]|nr:ABC transporter ATP-binding protein [Deltaproteobacteria bacterium]